jgi:hypothetical protein
MMIAAVTVAACTPETEPAPTAPDMQPLVAAYSAPDGRLTRETAPLLVEALIERGRTLESVAALVDSFSNANSGFGSALEEDDTEQSESGLSVRRQGQTSNFDGWGRVQYICPGWADGSVDRRWGIIELFALLESGGISEVVWGAAKQCHLPGTQNQQFHGELRYHVETQILAFDGDLTPEGGTAAPLQFHVQLLEEGISHQIDLEDGSGFVVTLFGADEGLQLTVTDVDGPWGCGADETTFQGRCERGDEVLEW